MNINQSASDVVWEGLEVRGVKCGDELYKKTNKQLGKMGGRIIMAVSLCPHKRISCLVVYSVAAELSMKLFNWTHVKYKNIFLFIILFTYFLFSIP